MPWPCPEQKADLAQAFSQALNCFYFTNLWWAAFQPEVTTPFLDQAEHPRTNHQSKPFSKPRVPAHQSFF
jgi:hypothetical protein